MLPYLTRSIMRRLFALVMMSLSVSCTGLTDISDLATVPITPIDSTVHEIKQIAEDQGRYIVFHGRDCADQLNPKTSQPLKMEGKQEFPDYVDDAIVYLNGWTLKYLSNEEHELLGLGAGIVNIRLQTTSGKSVLLWEAGGLLTDQHFDKEYQVCYTYTVLGWSNTEFDILTDQGDVGHVFASNDNSHGTAQKATAGYLDNPGFVPGDHAAVLPRGFGFKQSGTDHHVLQLAYHLDHSEAYIQAGKTYGGTTPPSLPQPTDQDHVESGFMTWETRMIMKDNSFQRDYRAGEAVSALSGKSVRVIHPPFSILPRKRRSLIGCVDGRASLKREEHIIENVPFEVAVPVLTGWDIGHICEDSEIEEVRVRISDFSYEKTPSQPTGTLRYIIESIVTNNDNEKGNYVNHKASVLGLVAAPPS